MTTGRRWRWTGTAPLAALILAIAPIPSRADDRLADGEEQAPLELVAEAAVAAANPVLRAPTMTKPALPGDLVGMMLVNRAGQPSRSQAVTFGQVFAAGTVPRGDEIAARIGTRQTPAQADVKTRYADGSIKHAILTLTAPALAAGRAVDVMLVAVKAAPSAPPVTANALLAQGYALTLRVTFADGIARDLDAADLLRQASAAGRLDAWLSGPLVSEFRVEARIDPLLRASFDIRAYADGRVRTGVMVANDTVWTANSRTVAYRADIRAAGQSVFTAGLSHHRAANWRRVVWSGGGQTGGDTVAVLRDVDYLIRTGAIPAFDTDLGVNATAVADTAAALAKADTGPLGAALIQKYMPTTGGRSDIGILPSWTSSYLISQDARAERAMYANADASGSAPWHFHDEATGQSVRIDQHPKLWLDYRAKVTANEVSATSLATLAKETGWTTDDAHTPSLAFVPYLLSGDRYYLDELQAVSAWRLGAFNPAYRSNIMAKQVRALAWELRDLGDAAYATPDAHPLKGYFVSQITQELALLRDAYVGRRVMRAAGEVEGWFMGDDSRVPGGLGPWQIDFMALALAGLDGHGFADARDLLDWSANFIAGRFISANRGFNPFYGPAYVLKLFDPVTKAPTPSWRRVLADSFADGGTRTSFVPESYPSCAYCYVAVAKAALAATITVTQSSRAIQAYNFLVTHTPADAMKQYRTVTNWAIRPRLPDGRLARVGETIPPVGRTP